MPPTNNFGFLPPHLSAASERASGDPNASIPLAADDKEPLSNRFELMTLTMATTSSDFFPTRCCIRILRLINRSLGSDQNRSVQTTNPLASFSFERLYLPSAISALAFCSFGALFSTFVPRRIMLCQENFCLPSLVSSRPGC